jgi:hypothetical protein
MGALAVDPGKQPISRVLSAHLRGQSVTNAGAERHQDLLGHSHDHAFAALLALASATFAPLPLDSLVKSMPSCSPDRHAEHPRILHALGAIARQQNGVAS